MNQKKIIAVIVLIAGFFTSICIGIDIYSKNNSVFYDFVINKRFSIIDIALAGSEESFFRSQVISIMLYTLFLIMVWKQSNKSYLKYFFLGLLSVNIIFEVYCVYLIFGDKYPGQHLRLNIIIFLTGLFLLKENKNS